MLASNCETVSRRFSTLGFKEIRYPSLKDPVPYIEFLVSVFDSPCIIHLTRNHLAAAESQSRKLKNKKSIPVAEIVSELHRFDNQMKTVSGKPYYFHIDYQDMINPDKRALAELFGFLGANFCASKVDSILRIPHSY
jgi:hypothetical protein